MNPIELKPFLNVGRVIKEDSDTITLQIAKHNKYQFKLSENKEKNKFLSIVFIRNYEGSPEPYWPFKIDEG